jgi:SOS response regulatory protein OraA/RecX
VFAEYNLFIGKQLDDKTILALRRSVMIDEFFELAIKKCSRKTMSTFMMREYLFNQGASDFISDEIITRLKDLYLLNDDTYWSARFTYLNDKNYSHRVILKTLETEGMGREAMAAFTLDEEVEKEKILNLLPTLLRKYDSYIIYKKEHLILEKLFSKGFAFDLTKKVVKEQMRLLKTSDIEDDSKDEEEKTRLKDEISLMLLKMKYTSMSDSQKQNKIAGMLLKKGYQYSEIKQILKEYNNEIDSGI